MTGWINLGKNLFLALTVAGLEDMGYEVSYDATTYEDLLSLPCCSSQQNLRDAGQNVDADNTIFDPDRELCSLKNSAK